MKKFLNIAIVFLMFDSITNKLVGIINLPSQPSISGVNFVQESTPTLDGAIGAVVNAGGAANLNLSGGKVMAPITQTQVIVTQPQTQVPGL